MTEYVANVARRNTNYANTAKHQQNNGLITIIQRRNALKRYWIEMVSLPLSHTLLIPPTTFLYAMYAILNSTKE